MSSSQSQNSSSKNPQGPLLTPKFLGSRISSIDSLAGILGVTTARLSKLAAGSDSYYRLHKRITKPDGSIREIYSIREPLKSLLKKVNKVFSKRCEYPNYLTGALPNWTYQKNAALHTGKGTVLTIDATNFFPSVSQKLVEGIWRDFFGFSVEAAQLLAELCCYKGALAQGNPTSSYLANLAFWDIEPLVVKELRSRGYTYSRYVDDICVSHSRRLTRAEKSWAIRSAQKIFLSRSMKVKSRKTKVMDRNVRQEVNGRTVNSGRVCASRSLKDTLRAGIHQFKEAVDSKALAEPEVERRYASLKGKLLHFMEFNETAANKLLAQLEHVYKFDQKRRKSS